MSWNQWAYKIEIRKYGKTVGNLTPLEVKWTDVVLEEARVDAMRDAITPCLKRNHRFEVTKIRI